MERQLIVILDYSTQEIHVFPYDSNIWESPEDFLIEHHSEQGFSFKQSNCHYMVVTMENGGSNLPVYIH